MYCMMIIQDMENEENSICGFCGCDICCEDGFKQHFVADHQDIIKKYAKKRGITPREWLQNAQEQGNYSKVTRSLVSIKNKLFAKEPFSSTFFIRIFSNFSFEIPWSSAIL